MTWRDRLREWADGALGLLGFAVALLIILITLPYPRNEKELRGPIDAGRERDAL